MNTCQHVSFAFGCAGCEYRAQRGDDQQEREQFHKDNRRQRERHHKERLKASENSRNPRPGGSTSRAGRPNGGGGGISLEGVAVLVSIFVACVIYTIGSTLVFAFVPLFAVAAVAALVAKHGLHKALPGRFDALPIWWWASIVVIAVIDTVFRSHPASFHKPIVNVTNLGLFLITLAAGYGLFVVYRRPQPPRQA